jgi:hypothetical protein
MADEHDLDMIAAGLRRDTQDVRVHGQAVLASLAAALPAEFARVDRSGGFLRKEKINALQVSLGDRRFVLKEAASGLVSEVCHESGGVVMSTTDVTFDVWVRELLAALSTAADRNASAAQALQRLAISGSTGAP